MQKNNNILNSIIAGTNTATPNVQITDPSATTTYIAAGEVVATTLDGTVLTSANTASLNPSEFVLVQGQGAGLPLIKSAAIKRSNVTKVASKAYSAPAEQVAHFGYTGAAGNIDVAPIAAIGSTNEYVLRVNFREDTKTFGDKMNMIIGAYIASYGNTNADIAFGLAKNINRSAYGWADVPVKAEVITSSAGTTVNAVNALVTNGSKTVTFSGAINVAIIAGSYLVFSGITYQVASVASTVVTLTMPYQGASVAALAGVNYFNGATVSAGIRITGLVRRFRAGVWKYYKVRFVLTGKNDGNTPITATTDADKGIGTGKEIQEIEWETVGNEGAFLRTPAPGSPVPVLRLNSKENSTYSVYNIQFFDQNGTGVVAAPVPSYKQLILAAELAKGTATTNLSAVLVLLGLPAIA